MGGKGSGRKGMGLSKARTGLAGVQKKGITGRRLQVALSRVSKARAGQRAKVRSLGFSK